MKPQECLPWLTLLKVAGLGPNGISELVKNIGSPTEVLNASYRTLCAIPGIGPVTARSILDGRNAVWAENQLANAQRLGIAILTLEDPLYPENLKQIHAPPPVLFVRGNPKRCSTNAIAIVGSRAITAYGRDIARRLSRELANRGFTVVSGMAVGIDTHAHRMALESRGKTVAVLGSGLDMPYPSENSGLFHQICREGAVFSEFPLGTKPEAHNFPRRNRIISGLSLGTVVVEAGQRSGALITAQFALEQNRDVFAVPGPIHSGRSLGTNRLIQQGAMLVHDVEDIIGELQPHLTAVPPPKPTASPNHLDLSPEQHAILQTLTPGDTVHIDEITRSASIPRARILECLLELELLGQTEQCPGMRYRRKA